MSKMEGRLSSAYVNDLLIFRLLLQLLKNPDSGNGGLPPGPIHFACFDSRSAPISVRLIFSLSLKIHLRIGNFVCCRRNLCSSNRRRPCYLCGTHACIARDRRVSKLEGRLSSACVNDLLIFRLSLQLLKNPDSGNGGLPPGPIHFACFDSRSAPISNLKTQISNFKT